MAFDWKEVSLPSLDMKLKPRCIGGLSISGGWVVAAGIPGLTGEMPQAAAAGILV